jgi:hypothetical protein
MVESKSKVNASAKVTDAVIELSRQAAGILRDGHDGHIMVNAYGVFSDRHKRRNELLDARTAIDKALALIDAAPWPSDADYDNI